MSEYGKKITGSARIRMYIPAVRDKLNIRLQKRGEEKKKTDPNIFGFGKITVSVSYRIHMTAVEDQLHIGLQVKSIYKKKSVCRYIRIW